MTDVIEIEMAAESAVRDAVEEQLVRPLTDRARSRGLQLTREGGLLGRLTKLVVGSALDGEMDDHLGYGKHDPAGRDGGNSRNGKRTKTVLTEADPVALEVPRDRDSSFEPRLVAKRQRRLSGVDELVISPPEHEVTAVALPGEWPEERLFTVSISNFHVRQPDSHSCCPAGKR